MNISENSFKVNYFVSSSGLTDLCGQRQEVFSLCSVLVGARLCELGVK